MSPELTKLSQFWRRLQFFFEHKLHVRMESLIVLFIFGEQNAERVGHWPGPE